MRKSFDYTTPETLSQLHSQLNETDGKVELLAGGTDLLVDIRNDVKDPECLVDLKNVPELQGVKYNPGEPLVIGAAATCGDLLEADRVRKDFPYLTEAAGELASRQVRNRATIIGNLCNASPCADMARPLLCLDATLEISSASGERELSLEEFFAGVKETELAEDEVVERLRISPEMANLSGGDRKLKRIKGHDLSLASVTMVKSDSFIRVAIGACNTTPVLLPELPADAGVEEICETAGEHIAPVDDVRATADYRQYMVKQYIRQIYEQLD